MAICSCCGKHKKPAGLEGLGTALKPAMELIAIARKPLSEKSIAENVLRWGTGALNIDATRIATAENLNGGAYSGGNKKPEDASSFFTGTDAGKYEQPSGRWPANLCLSWPADEYQLHDDVTTEQKRELFAWLAENAQ